MRYNASRLSQHIFENVVKLNFPRRVFLNILGRTGEIYIIPYPAPHTTPHATRHTPHVLTAIKGRKHKVRGTDKGIAARVTVCSLRRHVTRVHNSSLMSLVSDVTACWLGRKFGQSSSEPQACTEALVLVYTQPWAELDSDPFLGITCCSIGDISHLAPKYSAVFLAVNLGM